MNTNTGGMEGGLIEGLRQNAGWVTGIGILGRLNPGATSVSGLPSVDSLLQNPRVLVPSTPT